MAAEIAATIRVSDTEGIEMIVCSLDNFLGNPDCLKAESVYVFTLAFSGTYPTGGDTLNLAVQGMLSQFAPIEAKIYEQPTVASGAVFTGYQFCFVKGTGPANGKLQINASQGSPFSGSYGTTFATTIVKARVHFPLNM